LSDNKIIFQLNRYLRLLLEANGDDEDDWDDEDDFDFDALDDDDLDADVGQEDPTQNVSAQLADPIDEKTFFSGTSVFDDDEFDLDLIDDETKEDLREQDPTIRGSNLSDRIQEYSKGEPHTESETLIQVVPIPPSVVDEEGSDDEYTYLRIVSYEKAVKPSYAGPGYKLFHYEVDGVLFSIQIYSDKIRLSARNIGKPVIQKFGDEEELRQEMAEDPELEEFIDRWRNRDRSVSFHKSGRAVYRTGEKEWSIWEKKGDLVVTVREMFPDWNEPLEFDDLQDMRSKADQYGIEDIFQALIDGKLEESKPVMSHQVEGLPDRDEWTDFMDQWAPGFKFPLPQSQGQGRRSKDPTPHEVFMTWFRALLEKNGLEPTNHRGFDGGFDEKAKDLKSEIMSQCPECKKKSWRRGKEPIVPQACSKCQDQIGGKITNLKRQKRFGNFYGLDVDQPPVGAYIIDTPMGPEIADVSLFRDVYRGSGYRGKRDWTWVQWGHFDNDGDFVGGRCPNGHQVEPTPLRPSDRAKMRRVQRIAKKEGVDIFIDTVSFGSPEDRLSYDDKGKYWIVGSDYGKEANCTACKGESRPRLLGRVHRSKIEPGQIRNSKASRAAQELQAGDRIFAVAIPTGQGIKDDQYDWQDVFSVKDLTEVLSGMDKGAPFVMKVERDGKEIPAYLKTENAIGFDVARDVVLRVKMGGSLNEVDKKLSRLMKSGQKMAPFFQLKPAEELERRPSNLRKYLDPWNVQYNVTTHDLPEMDRRMSEEVVKASKNVNLTQWRVEKDRLAQELQDNPLAARYNLARDIDYLIQGFLQSGLRGPVIAPAETFDGLEEVIKDLTDFVEPGQSTINHYEYGQIPNFIQPQEGSWILKFPTKSTLAYLAKLSGRDANSIRATTMEDVLAELYYISADDLVDYYEKIGDLGILQRRMMGGEITDTLKEWEKTLEFYFQEIISSLPCNRCSKINWDVRPMVDTATCRACNYHQTKPDIKLIERGLINLIRHVLRIPDLEFTGSPGNTFNEIQAIRFARSVPPEFIIGAGRDDAAVKGKHDWYQVYDQFAFLVKETLVKARPDRFTRGIESYDSIDDVLDNPFTLEDMTGRAAHGDPNRVAHSLGVVTQFIYYLLQNADIFGYPEIEINSTRIFDYDYETKEARRVSYEIMKRLSSDSATLNKSLVSFLDNYGIDLTTGEDINQTVEDIIDDLRRPEDPGELDGWKRAREDDFRLYYITAFNKHLGKVWKELYRRISGLTQDMAGVSKSRRRVTFADAWETFLKRVDEELKLVGSSLEKNQFLRPLEQSCKKQAQIYFNALEREQSKKHKSRAPMAAQRYQEEEYDAWTQSMLDRQAKANAIFAMQGSATKARLAASMTMAMDRPKTCPQCEAGSLTQVGNAMVCDHCQNKVAVAEVQEDETLKRAIDNAISTSSSSDVELLVSSFEDINIDEDRVKYVEKAAMMAYREVEEQELFDLGDDESFLEYFSKKALRLVELADFTPYEIGAFYFPAVQKILGVDYDIETLSHFVEAMQEIEARPWHYMTLLHKMVHVAEDEDFVFLLDRSGLTVDHIKDLYLTYAPGTSDEIKEFNAAEIMVRVAPLIEQDPEELKKGIRSPKEQTAERLFKQGLKYHQSGDTAMALEMYQRALKKDTEGDLHGEISFNIGHLLAKHGRSAESIGYFETAAVLSPRAEDQMKAYQALGTLFLQSNMWKGALGALREADKLAQKLDDEAVRSDLKEKQKTAISNLLSDDPEDEDLIRLWNQLSGTKDKFQESLDRALQRV